LWVIALADASGVISSQKAFEALGPKFASTVIGTGPYILKEWVPRDHFTLVANPDFVGAAPHFKQIIGRPISEDKTAELAFRAGELQFTRIDPAVNLAGVPESKTIQLNAIDYIWIGPNMAKKPFDDLRVRQALRRAIDVEAILHAAYSGKAPRARALEAPGILGHWADAPLYTRDIAAAKALLAQAGLQDGFKTTLTVLNTAIAQTTAAVVQANLADVDIEVQIAALDPGAYWAYGDKDASQALELVLVEYKGKFDPGFQTQWFTSDQIGKWNWQRFASPEFDELTRRAAVTSDPKLRAQMYIDAQKLMDASAAFIWITHNAYSFADRSWLQPAILPNGNQWQFAAFKEV
jgi:peptide/nickel transport system substrate-binding protein